MPTLYGMVCLVLLAWKWSCDDYDDDVCNHGDGDVMAVARIQIMVMVMMMMVVVVVVLVMVVIIVMTGNFKMYLTKRSIFPGWMDPVLSTAKLANNTATAMWRSTKYTTHSLLFANQ